MATKKYLRTCEALAGSYGFSYTGVNGGGHLNFVNARGRRVCTSSTPSDSRRGMMNFERDLRRAAIY